MDDSESLHIFNADTISTKRAPAWKRHLKKKALKCIFLLGLLVVSLNLLMVIKTICSESEDCSPEGIILPKTKITVVVKEKPFNISFPQRGNCSELIKDISITGEQAISKYTKGWKKFQTVASAVIKTSVSNETATKVFNQPELSRETLQVYHYLATLPFVKNVCVVGLDAGYSAFQFLIHNPKTMVYAFDLGNARYTYKIGKYLKDEFPYQLKLTLGRSANMVQHDIEILKGMCNVILINSRFSYHGSFEEDIAHFAEIANGVNNIVVFNGIPGGTFQTASQAWQNAIERKKVSQLFQCTFKPNKDWGLTIGKYS